MPVKSLFGDFIEIEPEKEKVKKLQKKIAKPKQISTAALLKSKTVSIPEKLETIYHEVDRILGVYKEDTVVIDNIISFTSYIDECIKNKIIVVDTETNNSLDPLTCKLMGLCLYTPGQRNAYIPVNHTDLDDNKLPNQVSEAQIKEQLERVMQTDCKIIFHNAKFDYKVIYCTCDIRLRIDWDTLVGAKLLDENEKAGLKMQYITKIDPSIEKYSIDHLFTVQYQYVDPKVFALYAATDSFMTYKLYLWQLKEYDKPENNKIKKLLLEVEIPVLTVAASMELDGVDIDIEYADRLGKKYHKKLEAIEKKVADELNTLKPQIDAWRQTAAAQFRPPKKKIVTEATVRSKDYQYRKFSDGFYWVRVEDNYKLSNQEAEELKLMDKVCSKSPSEQLSDPVETTSPTQLAILLYDILNVPVVDRENPRGTGTEILKELADKYNIAKLLLEQRTILKLIDAFIDALPKMRSEKDGRIHAGFNSVGTATGRFSCTDP